MAEDLLDYWVRLIKPFFPKNAWIVTRYLGDDHFIEIDWKLDDDPKRPDRRSRKIQITISNGVIEDYLDKDKHERELFEISLKKLIHERYDHSRHDEQARVGASALTDKLFIVRNMLNA